ncbi:MAG: pantothenate kinase [Okeania sp. SIO2G4]|nr:pantothenate kinase [Okeania sp. SIO2H7]NEP70688.1 pantothenate kinase [Okeania sp. SIO2G5]NEP91933.1 pantothenate kinase [Okeania sp. SIO2F5]NEQ89356.1 pantothenate kinase [Okeania sp. SIO2G4]
MKLLYMSENQEWLGLMIGNTRLHWGYFVGAILQKTWDIDRIHKWEIEENINVEIVVRKLLKNTLETQNIKLNHQMPLLIASVVPQQTVLWETYPWSDMITLEKLPLQGLYPTLGIDRALAVLGAGTKLGWPVLVIDAGTAITFTGADVQKKIVGGSILPGLRLQLSSLIAGTAMLPLVDIPIELPPRWAKETATAIQSGIIYTVLAGIKDYIVAWREEFPEGQIVLTGGDRILLLTHFTKLFPELGASMIVAPEVIFWGIAKIWHQIY